jgi:hypothetical protein
MNRSTLSSSSCPFKHADTITSAFDAIEEAKIERPKGSFWQFRQQAFRIAHGTGDICRTLEPSVGLDVPDQGFNYSRELKMDKRISGLLGAVAALTALGAVQASAATGPEPARATQAAGSYADLLEPIPNALALLRADDEARAKRASEGRVQLADDHHHHHHHQVRRIIVRHDHHHHHHQRYDHHHHHSRHD